MLWLHQGNLLLREYHLILTLGQNLGDHLRSREVDICETADYNTEHGLASTANRKARVTIE